MSLAQLSLLFLLQMGFGSLVTFVVTDRRAVGPKYDKFGGWILFGLYGLAGTLVWGPALSAAAPAATRQLGLAVAVAAAAAVAFASVSGWDRPLLERAALGLALVSGAAALALAALRPGLVHGLGSTGRALALASSGSSALVLGFTTWGMILGHWYLVSQGLDIRHLARLVAPLPWWIAAKALVSGAALVLLWDRVLGPGNASLSDVLARQPDRVLDVANVWARIPVGLIVPGVLAGMTLVTVRMRKTQPATGILYAMCVTVYMGELMGRMVEGSTGVPL